MLSSPKNITLRDVAHLAGVSLATASRCLRTGGAGGAATRARVHAAAQALGYRTNPLFGEVMRSVRRRAADRHLGTLAHLVEPDHWESTDMRLGRYGPAVRAHALRYGFDIAAFPLGVPDLSPERLAQILVARGIDGVVLEVFPNDQFAERFPWDCFSSVLVGHSLRRPGLDCVVSDHSRGVIFAGETLLERGYRRVGLALESRHVADTNGAWVDGYHLLQHRHPQLHEIPPLLEPQMNEGSFITWLRKYRIDAVLTISVMNRLSNPMLRWLDAAGVTCPSGVALATLDRSFLPLPWSGLDQSSDDIAHSAVDLCFTKLRLGERGLPKVPRTILLHAYWCEGDTVSCTPSAK